MAIVAGAGVWGCTIARCLAEKGEHVLVLERRSAIGGNVRCEMDAQTGIEVHSYGSHIFHTSNEAVWNFVCRFVSFNDYRHVVLSKCGGKIYHLPFGCTLLKEFFGRDLKPSELTQADREAVFNTFIRGYTSKQWGVPPEKVDPAVIARLKVRDSYSTNYFDDPYQGIPIEGYNKLFENLLNHPNIEVQCGRAFSLADMDALAKGQTVYYSGPIDQLFDYKFGPLPWRSLRFEFERLDVGTYQESSVVNYPEVEVPYTRIHEFKHYHPEDQKQFKLQSTIICREYPQAWKVGDEPYYPINNQESAQLLAKYQDVAREIPNLVVGGRLGAFRYYDIDQAIAAALTLIG